MYNHPQFIRVYRPAREVKHDLHTVLNMLDVYGEWKRGTLVESDSDIIEEMAGTGVAKHPAQLVVDAALDVDEGYYLEVVQPMALDGQWAPVETTLSAALDADGELLTVVRATGFKSGHQIVLKDDSHSELTKVWSVSGSVLHVYADAAPHNAYASGATVRVSRFYRVISDRSPHGLADHKTFDLLEVMKGVVV